MCKTVQYMIVVTCLASVYTLVLMSLDRFLAVVHPISSMSIRTERNALMWVVQLFFPLYNSPRHRQTTLQIESIAVAVDRLQLFFRTCSMFGVPNWNWVEKVLTIRFITLSFHFTATERQLLHGFSFSPLHHRRRYFMVSKATYTKVTSGQRASSSRRATARVYSGWVEVY